jgi:hypothetical protein
MKAKLCGEEVQKQLDIAVGSGLYLGKDLHFGLA